MDWRHPLQDSSQLQKACSWRLLQHLWWILILCRAQVKRQAQLGWAQDVLGWQAGFHRSQAEGTDLILPTWCLGILWTTSSWFGQDLEGPFHPKVVDQLWRISTSESSSHLSGISRPRRTVRCFEDQFTNSDQNEPWYDPFHSELDVMDYLHLGHQYCIPSS